ncbi:DnaJ-like protein DjlA [uncultured Alphaproteobacteria bacterium]|uniref:DnaJ-like protein DjlA n=1 Tax=uncultured Alphaproteobacteria bacterium TaxID=91750 RepID=A0A212JK17_9PROT|nr:DnaJ-like protein DjlA [uncultured Alphaproteobacteria bacterium]
MSIWGKIIGGMAGFSLGGPLGALLGAAIGHAVDKRIASGEAHTLPPWMDAGAAHTEQQRQVAFTLAVIGLAAKMAKVDGVVTRAEIDAFKRLFQIPQHDMAKVGAMFDQARQTADGFEPYALQIAQLFHDSPAVLEELLHALFLIAQADGDLHPSEAAFLARVAQIFGFSPAHFETIRARARAGGASGARPAGEDPYAVLGLARSATDQEIKDTYRRLIRENHPDLLIAKGMPPELVANANATMAAINAAFEDIKRQRGLK